MVRGSAVGYDLLQCGCFALTVIFLCGCRIGGCLLWALLDFVLFNFGFP